MAGMGNGERDNATQLKLDLCVCGPMTRAEGICECEPEKIDGSGTASSFHFFEALLDEAHPSSKKFYDYLLDAGLLHAQKQRDYGKEHDPFANVKASEDWGIPGWVGAMVRANDKIRRLQTLATRGSLTNEAARDSFLDLAVYSLIALVLYEQETQKG